MTGTEITTYATSPLEDRMEYARTLAGAGDLIPKGLMFQPRNPETNAAMGPQQPSPGKIMLVMETGAMLGLHPIAALQGIHVIEGKASLSASTMSAVVRQAGHDLKVWTEGSVSDGTFSAHAKLVRSGETFEYTSVWDRDRAERAKLTTKDNWKNYFEAMAKARAISDVCRDGASDALAGVIYTPDELEVETNAQGEPVEMAEHREEEPAPAGAPKRRAATGRQGTRKKAAPTDAPTAPVETVSEPTAPAEDIVDADVVEDDPADEPQAPEPAAEEAPAPEVTPEALAKLRAARGADALEGESEVDYQNRKQRERQQAKLDERLAAEQDAIQQPHFRDQVTGQIFDTQADLDAAIQQRHADAKTAESLASWDDPQDGPALASVYEVAKAEELGREPAEVNWERMVEATVNQDELKDSYQEANQRGVMTTALRSLIMRRKNELPA